MCGISFYLQKSFLPNKDVPREIGLMNSLLSHRGPDHQDTWVHPSSFVALGHTRLSIIDLTTGNQPMQDAYGNVIVFNGEIYNYKELRSRIETEFRTQSDTEVILAGYRQWGEEVVHHLEGMFSFVIWETKRNRLFLARDHFGIKPLYLYETKDYFVGASEVKALLPFVSDLGMDSAAFSQYLSFQWYFDNKTLFRDVVELEPGHSAVITKERGLTSRKYWDFTINPDYASEYEPLSQELRSTMVSSVRRHLISDVPVATYLSGGVDSGIVGSVAIDMDPNLTAFHGRFDHGPQFDESAYAKDLASWKNIPLDITDITQDDFIQSIESIVYHLDYPESGPGAFPQFMVAKKISATRKVTLSGVGGDEMFGGYVRYLLAYFEQCIRGAIDGDLWSGNFVVTYDRILPHLGLLKNYKPLIQDFWAEGLFEEMPKRYCKLIDRSRELREILHPEQVEGIKKEHSHFVDHFESSSPNSSSYLDKMTSFDSKTFLRGLLHVEDRMTMAHGLESRVPFLDKPLVDIVRKTPSNIRMPNGELKSFLIKSMADSLPKSILERKNKMGFPVPIHEWMEEKGRFYEYVRETLLSKKALNRGLWKRKELEYTLESDKQFGRKVWVLLCTELWFSTFIDKAQTFQNMRERSA